jgi:uncharacterized protein (TIGR02646 family)
MIKRTRFVLSLTPEEHQILSDLKPWSGNYWDKPSNALIPIKVKIRTQLEESQTSCSYCGLKLKGTSKGEIEHIAAKASFRFPQFTFTLDNLVLACNWCNRPEKKGSKSTIAVLRPAYSECEFNLVHPYFDNPDEHYKWTDNATQILIQIKNNSTKAVFSIEMFGLDTPEMNEHRASQVRFDELKNSMPLSIGDERLLFDTINHKE